jgi:hypothetical protein
MSDFHNEFPIQSESETWQDDPAYLQFIEDRHKEAMAAMEKDEAARLEAQARNINRMFDRAFGM